MEFDFKNEDNICRVFICEDINHTDCIYIPKGFVNVKFNEDPEFDLGIDDLFFRTDEGTIFGDIDYVTIENFEIVCYNGDIQLNKKENLICEAT